MFELLNRIRLAIMVFRSSRDEVAVLWTPEKTDDGEWKAEYSGFVGRSEDPYEALESAAVSAARREWRENRGDGDE